MSLSLVRLPTHMDGFLYPLGNKDVYSYVSKPKTVVENYLKAKWRESRHYSGDSETRRSLDDRKVFIKRAPSKTKNGRDKRRVTPGPESSRRTAFNQSSNLDTTIVVKGYNNVTRIDKVVKIKTGQTIYDQTHNNPNFKRSTEDKGQNTGEKFEKEPHKVLIQYDDKGTQINSRDVEHFLRHQEVDWIAKALVSKTLQESLLDILNEKDLMNRKSKI